jgi:hypothetical protein
MTTHMEWTITIRCDKCKVDKMKIISQPSIMVSFAPILKQIDEHVQQNCHCDQMESLIDDMTMPPEVKE